MKVLGGVRQVNFCQVGVGEGGERVLVVHESQIDLVVDEFVKEVVFYLEVLFRGGEVLEDRYS